MVECAEIAGADSFCSTCDAAKTGGADAIGRRGSGRHIRRCSARESHRSSRRRPKPSCPERGQQRNVDTSRKRAAASSTCTSAPRAASPCNCPHRSHVCSADDYVRGARDCRPCPALCRATPPARGHQLPTAAMGARGRTEHADTARSPDAAAARRETARAYANQAARSDRKVGACTATTRGSPADSRPA